MTKVDYIIVGQGLAGSAVTQTLLATGMDVMVIDEARPNQASRIASGIWNPVVLKRMKKVWQADAMIPALQLFYSQTEELFKTHIKDNAKVNRLFASNKEVDEWLLLCDNPAFDGLLNSEIKKNKNANLTINYGLGEVTASGRIDTNAWLNAVRQYLRRKGMLMEEAFLWNELQYDSKSIRYKNKQAQGIIFCEGMYTSQNNPFFKNLPFALTKGEVITIHCPDLNLNTIINSSVFILPLGNELYKVGATYSWNDLDDTPTEKALKELLDKARKVIKVPFKVIEHQAGIRPTVKDRKPLLGTHKDYKNIHIFNGMGSRGVLMAPWLATRFVDYLENNTALPPETDINRFEY